MYRVARNYDRIPTRMPWQWSVKFSKKNIKKKKKNLRYHSLCSMLLPGILNEPSKLLWHSRSLLLGLWMVLYFEKCSRLSNWRERITSPLTDGQRRYRCECCLATLSYYYTYCYQVCVFYLDFRQVEDNMRSRAEKWANETFPYGSEFNFDTTGQEEVYIWLTYFNYTAEAQRTLDAVLSYMRTFPNWAYNGGEDEGFVNAFSSLRGFKKEAAHWNWLILFVRVCMDFVTLLGFF